MTDFETGEVCEAPASLWERVAACIELSADQAIMYGLFNQWWRTTNEVRGRMVGCLLGSMQSTQFH
jgi:hypothetical protein